MKIKREGLIWTAFDAANYLGLSEREIEELLKYNDIGSFLVGTSKKPKTTQNLCNKYLASLERLSNGNR